MVAKLIAHGRDRSDAIPPDGRAGRQPAAGVRNNARFLRDLLDHPQFRAARMHTATIDQWMQDGVVLLQAPQADASTWSLWPPQHWQHKRLAPSGRAAWLPGAPR